MPLIGHSTQKVGAAMNFQKFQTQTNRGSKTLLLGMDMLQNCPLEFNLLAVLPSSNFVDSLWTSLSSEEPEENLQLTPKETIKNLLSTASGLLFSNKTNASNRLQLFRCVFKFEPLLR